MDEDAGAFDMTQERMAQPGPAARSFDQPGHVRDRQPAFVIDAEVHHAQIRFECGERVVGDLG